MTCTNNMVAGYKNRQDIKFINSTETDAFTTRQISLIY